VTSTIAIVEDDDIMREALHGLILSFGYEPLTFASAEDYAASACSVDCLILDVRLPGIGGLQLHRHLRDAGHAPPVIFLTSYGDDDTRARALSGGALFVLSKPADDETILACIDAALARTAAGSHPLSKPGPE
jgi:FixJ family two-component response regulator